MPEKKPKAAPKATPHHDAPAPKASPKPKTAEAEARTGWLDDKASPKIQAYTEKLGTFLEAMADGVVDEGELKSQEARLVALMKKVEPQLSDPLHEEVTQLLCELTAHTIMKTVHDLTAGAPRAKTKFRG